MKGETGSEHDRLFANDSMDLSCLRCCLFDILNQIIEQKSCHWPFKMSHTKGLLAGAIFWK